MPIFPVPRSNRQGFSLIEVLIASAIAAMIITTAATSIISSEKTARADAFYRGALLSAQHLHARRSGIDVPERISNLAVKPAKSGGDEKGRQGWLVYEISDASGGRRMTTCMMQ